MRSRAMLSHYEELGYIVKRITGNEVDCVTVDLIFVNPAPLQNDVFDMFVDPNQLGETIKVFEKIVDELKGLQEVYESEK